MESSEDECGTSVKRRIVKEYSNEKPSTKRFKDSEDIIEENNKLLNDTDEEGIMEDIENQASEDEEESVSDPYIKHFEYELPEQFTEEALNPKQRLGCISDGKQVFSKLGIMERWKILDYSMEDPQLNKKSIDEFPLKKNLLSAIQQSSKKLSNLELSFLNIITNYIDVIYQKELFRIQGNLRFAYCVHILNHILKAKARIIHHNSKLKKNPDAEYRDQGFTQPTVVILVPFRGDCHRIVNQIISILPKCKVMNKSRFEKEYGPDTMKSKKKPEDYYEIFDGNSNEDFKIGLRIQNEHVSLYSGFYRSDLIIASPLGLRPIIGDVDNKHGDSDFLSSVEILIVDRLDILMIQNPVHLDHIFKCFNHLVKKEHDNKKINYFRVRMYALDKKAKYYRQNIFLSSVEHIWFSENYYLSNCFNYKGFFMSFDKVSHPMIDYIHPTMQMCFRIFDSDNPLQEYKDRRAFFFEKVLPDFVNDKSTFQTLIFIPSYFDYMEIRHHFRINEISCFMMCEYTKKGKKAQGRNLFFKGHRHFMLYTERTHFYFRHLIKGIQHIIFFKLPTSPKFFREICNSLVESHPNRKDEERTCTVIASPLDYLLLKHIVGIPEADRMLKSKQKTFVKYVGSQ